VLTADLVRGTLRQGVVHPRFIDASDPAAERDAATLIDLFRTAEGDTVADLEEAVESTFAGRHDILFVRGLTKLLMDLTELDSEPVTTRADPEKVISPEAIRAALFGLAAQHHPVRPGGGEGFFPREAVIAEAAEQLDLRPEDLERGLYADLKSAQKVGPLLSLAPRELLERYNLALAQACLFRAREVRVTLTGLEPRRLQALIRALKFRRVLFRVGRPRTDSKQPTLGLTLDGPLSLFKHTSRYGLALAHILPELARCPKWSLEAEIRWGRERKDALLKLSDRSPLVPHTPDRGTWVSAEERHLIESFATLDTPWRLEPVARLVDLDGLDVLAPDFVLSHPDGRVALVELVFSWRLDAFTKRLDLLRSVGPKNLVIAITERGRLDDGRGQTAPLAENTLALYRFKGLIQPKRLVELAERVAIRETLAPPEDPTPPAKKRRSAPKASRGEPS
jgi:predicted nuclease of restriction endonuclease-like RecB superfamily